MSVVPTKTQADAAQKDAAARKTLAYVQSLKKCPGWVDWMGPKIFAAYDQAQESILDSAKQGQPAAPEKLLLFATLHPLVSEIRGQIQRATQRVGSLPPETDL